jgi:hypothetical protein
VDLATVQAMLGHASPATTARYDRRGERAVRQAAARVQVPYTGSDVDRGVGDEERLRIGRDVHHEVLLVRRRHPTKAGPAASPQHPRRATTAKVHSPTGPLRLAGSAGAMEIENPPPSDAARSQPSIDDAPAVQRNEADG